MRIKILKKVTKYSVQFFKSSLLRLDPSWTELEVQSLGILRETNREVLHLVVKILNLFRGILATFLLRFKRGHKFSPLSWVDILSLSSIVYVLLSFTIEKHFQTILRFNPKKARNILKLSPFWKVLIIKYHITFKKK